jgi:hypothetical protein
MDKTAKILLAAIAIGLWVNIAVIVFRPVAANAQNDDLSGIATNVQKIENGTCTNLKIC